MSILKFKNNVIPYTVNKAMSGALCICVDGNEVIVNAPWYVSRRHIQEVIIEKRQWIISKIEEYNKNRNSFLDKGVIKLLGNDYHICILYKNHITPTINLINGKVEVILPAKYKKLEDSDILRILMEKLYFKVCCNELEKSMEKARLLLGIAPEDYCIEDLGNTIAKFSFDDRCISFSPCIARYRSEIIDYIVIHEFCHLKYKTHSKGFWNIIGVGDRRCGQSRLQGGEDRQLLHRPQAHGNAYSQCGGAELPRQAAGQLRHRRGRAVSGDGTQAGVVRDRKSTRLNSSHDRQSRMPSSA